MSWTIKKEDGDIVLSDLGRWVQVSDEEKLAQDVADMQLTDYNPARGIGSDLVRLSRTLVSPGVMPVFGEAFLQRALMDASMRLYNLQSRDPRSTATERLDPSKTKIDIRRIQNTDYMYFLTVSPQAGSPRVVSYRIRLRHQYPNQSARSIFPASVVTDDMVP